MELLTGGSGLLGRELLKLCNFVAPSHSEFDLQSSKSINKWVLKFGLPDFIVHCAAYTDVAKAETSKNECYDINVRGTSRLSDLKVPIIYISTEYIFDGDKGNYSEEDVPNPRNFYALTKLLGEFETKRTKSLIIRTLLKPRPFEHPAACVDQFTSGDYVDVIAKEIIIAVNAFRNNHVFDYGIINIGTGRKSTYDLASQSRSVIPITVESVGVRLPKDTSLNIDRWITFKGSI